MFLRVLIWAAVRRNLTQLVVGVNSWGPLNGTVSLPEASLNLYLNLSSTQTSCGSFQVE